MTARHLIQLKQQTLKMRGVPAVICRSCAHSHRFSLEICCQSLHVTIIHNQILKLDCLYVTSCHDMFLQACMSRFLNVIVLHKVSFRSNFTLQYMIVA